MSTLRSYRWKSSRTSEGPREPESAWRSRTHEGQGPLVDAVRLGRCHRMDRLLPIGRLPSTATEGPWCTIAAIAPGAHTSPSICLSRSISTCGPDRSLKPAEALAFLPAPNPHSGAPYALPSRPDRPLATRIASRKPRWRLSAPLARSRPAKKPWTRL
jgi:hypothetical protein